MRGERGTIESAELGCTFAERGGFIENNNDISDEREKTGNSHRHTEPSHWQASVVHLQNTYAVGYSLLLTCNFPATEKVTK